MRGRSAIELVLLALAIQPVLTAQGQPASAGPSRPVAAAPKPKDFVGDASCGTCHEEIAKGFTKDRHHAIELNEASKGKSCEACHGPGSAHAESLEPKDIIRRNAAACGTCHNNQASRLNRTQAGHTRSIIDCFNCHGMHKPVPLGLARSRQITDTCNNCHTDVRAQFQKPHRHPVSQPSPVMSCVDCHDPHGGPLPAMLRNVRGAEPQCVGCHGDKRGPFIFEHAPVRLEGCGACHEPHGSANPKMLRRQEERFVCLECHANIGGSVRAGVGVNGAVPPAIHDLRSPRYRGCTTCHVKVHGSHANRSFLR